MIKKVNIKNLYRLAIIIDKIKGLDFELTAQVEQFGYDSKLVHRSSPTDIKKLRSALNWLKIENNAILDIGCGKGNAMRHMLQYPFLKIHGIELVNEIANVAFKNFSKIKDNRVLIFNENATDFKYYSNYDMFYFYNPFPEEILEIVLKNILSTNQFKTIHIIYNNPKGHNLLIKYLDFIKSIDGINIYMKSFK